MESVYNFHFAVLNVTVILLFSAELKMDVLRERECKDSIERQLSEERKLRGKYRHFMFRTIQNWLIYLSQ